MHKAKYVHNRKLQIWGPHVDITIIYNPSVTVGRKLLKLRCVFMATYYLYFKYMPFTFLVFISCANL